VRSRFRSLFAALLLLPLLPIGHADALTSLREPRSVDAKWSSLYSSNQSSPKITAVHPVKLSKKSSFVVNFSGVPDKYRPAITAATDLWANTFNSSVPINIRARALPIDDLNIIARATPVKFFNNFSNIPDNTLWYTSAMANAIAGKDLDPKNPEISIDINANLDPQFYLQTDGNVPTGEYDLESIVVHELGHGLGFLSNTDYVSGVGSLQQPTPFDAYAQSENGKSLADYPCFSLALGTAMTSPLYWSGPNAIAANGNSKPKLYAPPIFDPGSSISHLDEDTYPSGTPDALMTPRMPKGEVFHTLGNLLPAMMLDMRIAPPQIASTSVPTTVRNPAALVGDHSALITFTPACPRVDHVKYYEILNSNTGITTKITQNSYLWKGLNAGVSYSFSITAVNDFGSSTPVSTNEVLPTITTQPIVLDPTADGKYLAMGELQGLPTIVYSDTKNGDVKLATYSNNKWRTSILDGNGSTNGRTRDNVAGPVSICSYGKGSNQQTAVLYADLDRKTLHAAIFSGGKWSYSIVDGDGPRIQPYQEATRVRTASDVSVSNACAYTKDGLQVFYRDESQGILLGAVKDGGSWRYEIVDGDRSTDSRTTGDVGFHLAVSTAGNTVNLFYDSVLTVDSNQAPILENVRLATRSSAYPEDWKYTTIDGMNNAVPVAGYDVALSSSVNTGAVWLASLTAPLTVPQLIRTVAIGSSEIPTQITTGNYGIPRNPIAINGTTIAFSCQARLCTYDTGTSQIRLLSGNNFDNAAKFGFITIAKKKYVVANNLGKMSLFKVS
jgi:hypothetical protein